MKRFALCAIVLWAATGCRAPMPNWNMFGPYGATRVPPPPTGGYGSPQPYYAPPTTSPTTTIPSTQAPVGTGFRAPVNRWSNITEPQLEPLASPEVAPSTRSLTSDVVATEVADADVILASHETVVPLASPPATVIVEHDGPIRILPPNTMSTTSAPPQLRGMAVNDVTRPREPGLFVPSDRIIDISQLPNAPRVNPSPSLREAPATQPQSATSTNQATILDNGWRSRTTTLRVSGS